MIGHLLPFLSAVATVIASIATLNAWLARRIPVRVRASDRAHLIDAP